MLLRYRHWNVDGVSAHKAIRGAAEYVFLDSDHGVCDVRDREGIEYLLERKANYEVAFEKYNIFFDAQGQQVEVTPTTGTHGSGSSVSVPEPTTRSVAGEVPSKRKPGRPRKG